VNAVDVVVVGGGVMGSAAAWHLAQRGVDVVLLERYEPGHARGSSHGSSRIVRLAYEDPFYVELAATAFGQWEQLEDACGLRLLTWTGVVDHGDAATVSALAANLRMRGHATEMVNPREAALRWPGLRFDGPVLFHPHGGQVHADRTVAAMQAVAARHGADVRHGVRVEAIEPGIDGVLVRDAAETWRARSVVVAAGAWTDSLLRDLVTLPPMTVTREQPAHFPSRDSSAPWPSFIHHLTDAATRRAVAPRGAYGLPSPDGIKVGFHAIGPVIDPETDERNVDDRQLRKVRDYVRTWVPGVDPERPSATPCIYALTRDTDFVIDRVGPVVIATGFSGHGFKFAPEIGRILADIAEGTGSAPDRFALRRARP
jgi:sarcosine oxidase